MKIRVVTLTALALVASVGGNIAIAQDAENSNAAAPTAPVVTVTEADTAVVNEWRAAADTTAKRAVLGAALLGKPQRAWVLMAVVENSPATERAALLADIIAVLTSMGEVDLVAEMVAVYGDVIAQAAAEVETAAGDETTDANFGGDGEGNPAENGSQLGNTPTDTNPSASPVTP